MSQESFYVSGDLYITLPGVARLFQVEVHWLQEVYELGLLGSGARSATYLGVAAHELDRVATVVRLHVVLGLDIDAIELALENF